MPIRSISRRLAVKSSLCSFFHALAYHYLALATAAPAGLIFTSYDRSNLPMCRNNSHVEGEWVIHPAFSSSSHKTEASEREEEQSHQKSFVCCGGAHHHENAEDDFKYIDPKYCHQQNTILSYYETGFVDKGAQCGDDCCRCDRVDETRYSLTERERYQWTPRNCNLAKWNATLFCELLGERKVLIMGDSTMQQTSSTLMSMLGQNHSTCGPQLRFSRSDFVMLRARNMRQFSDMVEQEHPDIAVVTWGAHLEDEGDMWDLIARLTTYLDGRNKQGLPNPKIIWKSQNPPHPGCVTKEELHRPLTSYGVDMSSDPEDKQKQSFVTSLDRIVVNYVKNSQSLLKLLDMSPLYLRPDAHVRGTKSDCMHYCMPGPLDLFSILFLQMLINGEV